MKNKKSIALLLMLLLFFGQCSKKSDDLTPQLTPEQIKSLIGTTWILQSHSGSITLQMYGMNNVESSQSLANSITKIIFKDATTLLSVSKDLKENLNVYNVSANELYISNGTERGTYYYITLDGNSLTLLLDSERFTKSANELGYKDFKVISSDIKLIYKR